MENSVIQIEKFEGRAAGRERKEPVELRRQRLFLLRKLVDDRQEL